MRAFTSMALRPLKSSLKPSRTIRYNRRSAAFTLIGLLVVIVIVAILAASLLPCLSKAKAAAHSASCKKHLRQMSMAVKLYLNDDYSNYPFFVAVGGSANGDATSPMGFLIQPGILWSSRLIPYFSLRWTNTAFHCPGYKGVILGPTNDYGLGNRCLGSYGYNAGGVNEDPTYDPDSVNGIKQQLGLQPAPRLKHCPKQSVEFL